METGYSIEPNYKVSKSICYIARNNNLSHIVEKYGVYNIWNLIKSEIEDDIFTPYSEMCLCVLKKLDECN